MSTTAVDNLVSHAMLRGTELGQRLKSRPPPFKFSCLPPKSPSQLDVMGNQMLFDDGNDDDDDELDVVVAAGSLPSLSEQFCVHPTDVFLPFCGTERLNT